MLFFGKVCALAAYATNPHTMHAQDQASHPTVGIYVFVSGFGFELLDESHRSAIMNQVLWVIQQVQQKPEALEAAFTQLSLNATSDAHHHLIALGKIFGSSNEGATTGSSYQTNGPFTDLEKSILKELQIKLAQNRRQFPSALLGLPHPDFNEDQNKFLAALIAQQTLQQVDDYSALQNTIFDKKVMSSLLKITKYFLKHTYGVLAGVYHGDSTYFTDKSRSIPYFMIALTDRCIKYQISTGYIAKTNQELAAYNRMTDLVSRDDNPDDPIFNEVTDSDLLQYPALTQVNPDSWWMFVNNYVNWVNAVFACAKEIYTFANWWRFSVPPGPNEKGGYGYWLIEMPKEKIWPIVNLVMAVGNLAEQTFRKENLLSSQLHLASLLSNPELIEEEHLRMPFHSTQSDEADVANEAEDQAMCTWPTPPSITDFDWIPQNILLTLVMLDQLLADEQQQLDVQVSTSSLRLLSNMFTLFLSYGIAPTYDQHEKRIAGRTIVTRLIIDQLINYWVISDVWHLQQKTQEGQENIPSLIEDLKTLKSTAHRNPQKAEFLARKIAGAHPPFVALWILHLLEAGTPQDKAILRRVIPTIFTITETQLYEFERAFKQTDYSMQHIHHNITLSEGNNPVLHTFFQRIVYR